MLLNYHIGRFVVISVLQAEALLQPAARLLLKTNRTKSPAHSETRTKRRM